MTDVQYIAVTVSEVAENGTDFYGMTVDLFP